MSYSFRRLRNWIRDVDETDDVDHSSYVLHDKGVFKGTLYEIRDWILLFLYKLWQVCGIIIIIFTVNVRKLRVPIPSIGNRQILNASVTVIAEKIRSKQLSSEEVVQTFIRRINEVNWRINCVVDERFSMAIEEAKEVDRLIQSDTYDQNYLRTNYPLLGVPFTIKEVFSVKGIKQTSGLYERRYFISTEDAPVVEILKKAGAIPLGVTNVSELCMWVESVNTVYGRSKNPYDTRHTVGGSSGGEAGLQAAAGSAFGIGSDIGGSVRLPAFFCGVYGHKPSKGLISIGGQEPKATGMIREFVVTGTLLRHAVDLSLIFTITIPIEKRKILKPAPSLNKIRIFYMEDDGGSPLATPVSRELKNIMKRAVEYLEERFDLITQKARINKLYNSLEIWASAIGTGTRRSFCEELGMGRRKVNPFWEMSKLSLGYSHHTFPALALGVIEKIVYLSTRLPIRSESRKMGKSLALQLHDLLGDDGILLYPSHPSVAPRHYVPLTRPFDFSYTAIFNIIGVPVIQVPLGLNAEGLPLGIQIVGGMFCDLLLMKVAEALEQGFGGWTQP